MASENPLGLRNCVAFHDSLIDTQNLTRIWLCDCLCKRYNCNFLQFLNPVYIGFLDTNVLSEANQVLKLEATDLMGRAVDVNVIMESIADKTGRKSSDIQFLQGLASSDS